MIKINAIQDILFCLVASENIRKVPKETYDLLLGPKTRNFRINLFMDTPVTRNIHPLIRLTSFLISSNLL
jgi:hypothetical protein